MIIRKIKKYYIVTTIRDCIVIVAVALFMLLAFYFDNVGYGIIALALTAALCYFISKFVSRQKDIVWISRNGIQAAQHFGRTLLLNNTYKTLDIKKVYESPTPFEFVDAFHGIIYLSKDKFKKS